MWGKNPVHSQGFQFHGQLRQSPQPADECPPLTLLHVFFGRPSFFHLLCVCFLDLKQEDRIWNRAEWVEWSRKRVEESRVAYSSLPFFFHHCPFHSDALFFFKLRECRRKWTGRGRRWVVVHKERWHLASYSPQARKVLGLLLCELAWATWRKDVCRCCHDNNILTSDVGASYSFNIKVRKLAQNQMNMKENENRATWLGRGMTWKRNEKDGWCWTANCLKMCQEQYGAHQAWVIIFHVGMAAFLGGTTSGPLMRCGEVQ